MPRLAFALLLALAPAAVHAATFVAWSPSLSATGANPDNLPPAFEFRPSTVLAPERRRNNALIPFDDGPDGGGALVLDEAPATIGYRQPDGAPDAEGPFSIPQRFIRTLDMRPHFDAIDALRKKHKRAELTCARIESRARKAAPGDTHLLLICTDSQFLVNYLIDLGEKIKLHTNGRRARGQDPAVPATGVGHGQVFAAFPEAHRTTLEAGNCYKLLTANCENTEKPLPAQMEDRQGGYKVGTCQKETSCAGFGMGTIPVIMMGYKSKVGSTSTAMWVRRTRGAVTSVILAFKGTSSGTEAFADVNLLSKAFLERWRVMHLGSGLPKATAAAYGAVKAISEGHQKYLHFIADVVNNELIPLLKNEAGEFRANVYVYLTGVSLGGFMAQLVGLHLIAVGFENVYVNSISGPGAVLAYLGLAETMFGAAPPGGPRWPQQPERFVNVMQFFDWIPRLGRQPGFSCFSYDDTEVVTGGHADDVCGLWGNLQSTGLTGSVPLGKGACMKIHNVGDNLMPSPNTFCCQAGATWCGLYIPPVAAGARGGRRLRRAQMERA